MSELTLKRLSELLNYDPETGAFRWRNSGSGRRRDLIAGAHTSEGYMHICIDGRSYRSARLALFYTHGRWPHDEVDHINHIRDDDRLCNLREVDRGINGKNCSMSPRNESGHTGVTWNKREKKWMARIRVKGVQYNLGYYHDMNDAVAARREAEKRYDFHPNHGKEKRPNFPPE